MVKSFVGMQTMCVCIQLKKNHPLRWMIASQSELLLLPLNHCQQTHRLLQLSGIFGIPTALTSHQIALV